jgi:outer membrane protein
MRRSLTTSAAGIAATIFALTAAPRAARAIERIHPNEKLTLARAIELTLHNHPRGLEMRAEAAAASERVGEARAALLPQVYGAGEYLRSTDNPIGNTSYLNPGFVPRITGTLHGEPPEAAQSFSTSTVDNYIGGVGAQQYLWDFGRVRGRIDEEADNAQAAEARKRLTDLDLVFTATQRYFALLAAQARVKVYQKAVEQRTEQAHAAQVRASAGLTSQIDVLTAQAALARARTNLLDAYDQQATARVALDNIMAAGPEAPSYQLADVLTYRPVTGNVEKSFRQAIKLRPDLLMLEAQARAAGARITEARSDFFPTVEAAAGYTTMGTGFPAANNFDAGLVITWPIFNGFETEHAVQEAKLRQDAVRYAMEELELHIWLEVKSSFLDLQTSVERIHQAEATVAASAGELELADKRYTAGLGNIIELTDAERFYSEDNAAYVDALYTYSVAKAALQRATGAALPPDAGR